MPLEGTAPKRASGVESTLPPETLDSILNIIHDEPKTLRNSCIAAKSWIPRTTKHLFAEGFRVVGGLGAVSGYF